MKILTIFCFLFLACGVAHAKQVTLTLTDEDIQIVENDVVDAVQWLKSAWAGKVSKCKSRIINNEIYLSIKNNEQIPAGEEAIVLKYLQRPDYKNRKQRDLENLNK